MRQNYSKRIGSRQITGVWRGTRNPTSPLVLIIPGTLEGPEGRHGVFSLLQKELAKRRIPSLSLRMGYCGERNSKEPTKFREIGKEARTISRLARNLKGTHRKVGILGVSLGGLVALLSESNPNSLALWYPVVRPWKKRGLLNPRLSGKQKKELTRTGKLEIVKGNTGERIILSEKFLSEIGKLDASKNARRTKCLAIILHPEKDSFVDYSESERLFSILPGKRILIPLACDHGFWNIGRTRPDWKEMKRGIELTADFFEGALEQ